MKNFSYKTLLIIFFFLLIGVIVLARFVLPQQKIKAAWWNDSWMYRKAISISNTSGSNLTDFQVSLSVGTSALIASGKMQSDCDDIRVTDINGNLLPYWIEENNPGCNQATDTKIWIKTSSLPTSGSTVYLYYGNTSAANNEKGDQVFEFFDDFNDGIINTSKWTTYVSGGSVTETGGSLQLTGNSTWNTNGIASNISFNRSTIGYNFSWQAKFSHTGANVMIGSSPKALNYSIGIQQYLPSSNIWYEWRSNVGTSFASTYTTNTWYSITTKLKSGTGYSLYKDGNLLKDDTTFADNNSSVVMQQYAAGKTSYFNYVYLTKYASADPTSTLQSEEIGTAPIAYWKFDEGIGTTAYDSTSNQNNGIIGATWKTEDQCISDKCLSFNGISNVTTVPSSLGLKPSNITVSLWLKTNEDTSVQPWNGILQGVNGDGYSYGWRLIDNANKPGFQMNFGDGSPKTLYGSLMGVGRWNHVVITYDHQYMRIYQNGVQVGTPIAETRDINWGSSTNLLIGYAQYYFNGLIDEVKIYPYARTADQIKLDYNSRGSKKGSSGNLGIKSSTAPDLNSKLVAYYKFDEGSGTIINNSIVSSVGLSGVFGVGNSAPSWSSGKYGIGLSFDGTNDYVQIPNMISSDDTHTISFWVKPLVFNKVWIDMSGDSGYSFIQIGANQLYVGYSPTGSATYRTYNYNFTAGNWYYIAIVKTGAGDNADVYINGKILSSYTGTIGNMNSGSVMYLGKFHTSASYNINGIIDEVKIYNSALSADEIKMDYNRGSTFQMGQTNQTIGGTTTSLEYCIPGDTSYCANPIAEWNFEENIGTTAHDTSGNNNHGTFGTGNSAPTWTVGKNNKGAGLKFLTNQYINIPTITPTINNKYLTIEGWINFSSLTGIQRIFSISGSSPMIGITSGTLFIHTTTSAGSDVNTPLTALPSNCQTGWHHLATTWDTSLASNNIKVYCDGNNFTNGTLINGLNGTFNINSFFIGYNTSNQSINGKIDNVKIYNYARTPAQIAYDYNKGAPIGWWKLDECQGLIAFDSSGLGNTGAISIGASGTQNTAGTCQIGTSAAWTSGASGKLNSSLNFDGTDDFINCGSNINTPSEITFSGWIKPSNVTLPTQSIVAYSPSGQYNYWLYLDNKNIKISAFSGTYPNLTISNVIQTNNIWYHIVFTAINGGSIKVFINGTKVGEGAAGNTYTASGNITIGDLRVDRNLRFSGQIDDVRIYNYALTPEQVKVLYNGGAVSFN